MTLTFQEGTCAPYQSNGAVIPSSEHKVVILLDGVPKEVEGLGQLFTSLGLKRPSLMMTRHRALPTSPD